MYGAIEFYNKAVENNLKPIIGLEIIYEGNKIILIALDHMGYLNLCKISTFVMTSKKYNIKNYLDSICVIYCNHKPA
jgi:DNA polymerase-3 subunit alpha